jgi:hypothetical protein
MFAQVIQGKVSDPAGLRAAMERWMDNLSSGATGWLGTTAGVADDGTAIALARFESEDAARRNSDRPQQGEWWEETARLFSGDVTFHDCREVITLGEGGSDDAGFVQIIQGRAKDEVRLRQLGEEFGSRVQNVRPDVIGGLVALHGDARFTQAVYFKSEAEARRGESDRSPEAQQGQNELMSLIEDVRFYDLRQPWLHSPH